MGAGGTQLPGVLLTPHDYRFRHEKPAGTVAPLLETLSRAGVRIPHDVSIIGWDDSSLSRLPHLNLTTVRQDAAEMTRLAIERSAARLGAQAIGDRELVLSPTLTLRGSTGAMRPVTA